MGTKSAWTPARRAAQAERARQAKPWLHSTGPKTEAGKAVSARNAYRGGYRELFRAVNRLGRAQRAVIRRLNHMEGRGVFDPDAVSWRTRKRSQRAIDADIEKAVDLYLDCQRVGEATLMTVYKHLAPADYAFIRAFSPK